MGKDGAFSHKKDYVLLFLEKKKLSTLNLKVHLNHFIGSKVTAILVNGGILPTGGVASRRVCCQY